MTPNIKPSGAVALCLVIILADLLVSFLYIVIKGSQ